MIKHKTKIAAVLLLLALVIGLAACGDEEPDTDNPGFDALTLTSGTSLMVDAKGADYIEQLDLISVWLPEGEEQPPIGSLVRYTIQPEIMESYPPQARAISMEIIKGNSKPVKTSLDIAVRIKEHQPSDTVILDVRTPEEFSQGHVAEAVNLPLAELNADTLSPYDSDGTMIVYSRIGNRSASAARTLDKAEFKVVIDAGGINSYSGEKVVE